MRYITLRYPRVRSCPSLLLLCAYVAVGCAVLCGITLLAMRDIEYVSVCLCGGVAVGLLTMVGVCHVARRAFDVAMVRILVWRHTSRVRVSIIPNERLDF